MSTIPCELCGKDILFEEFPEHILICEIVQETKEEPVLEKTIPEIKLTKCQLQSLEYSYKKSKIFSKNTKPNLELLFLEHKHNKEDIRKIVKYIRLVSPINIHVNLTNILKHLVKDDHYRNVFETNTKGDGYLKSREIWEKSRFNDFYRGSEPNERVKYGAINLTNNPTGVPPARAYGESYLVLRQDVKMRTTFLLDDSSKQELHICTFRDFYHLIHYLGESKELLQELIHLARGEITESNIWYPKYVECQIHGPVRLKYDVEYLAVNSVHKNNREIIGMLEQFTHNHDVPVVWFNAT